MGRKSTSDPVERYALDVTSGKEVAGPLVRLACERQLRDLKDGEARGIWWDWPAAKRIIDFFRDVLRLTGGEHEGKPFELHPSQKFILGSLFGWKAEDGSRRFRVSYSEIGKGNGKSPLAAGVGLYMMMADNEPRAEVYAMGYDKDQAQVLFRDAVAMVDQSQALDSRLTRSGGAGKEWNLAYLETGSFFRPISSEHVGGRGKSGPRPHCVLVDELHEHPSSAMVEFMRAGTKGRRQALVFMITNAGVTDNTSVCFAYHNYAEKVLNGQIEDDGFFAYVCGLDKNDDWTDPNVWKKANPLLGVSITPKYLSERVHEAEGMPSKQSLTRRLNFCEWVEAADPFVTTDVWKANGGIVDEEALVGRACFGGLDLSGKNALTSLKLIFEADETGRKPIICRFWTPEEGLKQREEQDRAPYAQWVREGHLIKTPGATIDYQFVAAEIAALTKKYRITAIAFDRWRIDDLRREFDEDVDVLLLEHGQGFKDMSPAIEALEDELKDGVLNHGDHPVLTWCVANTRVVKDPAGLRKFDKRKATGRIDGAVALAMACRAAKIQPVEPQTIGATIL
jgi:phage terminase large subunit-like protein